MRSKYQVRQKKNKALNCIQLLLNNGIYSIAFKRAKMLNEVLQVVWGSLPQEPIYKAVESFTL